jgi:hypothetical protein
VKEVTGKLENALRKIKTKAQNAKAVLRSKSIALNTHI